MPSSEKRSGSDSREVPPPTARCSTLATVNVPKEALDFQTMAPQLISRGELRADLMTGRARKWR